MASIRQITTNTCKQEKTITELQLSILRKDEEQGLKLLFGDGHHGVRKDFKKKVQILSQPV